MDLNSLHLVTAVIAFASLAHKSRQLWRDPRNPALRAICVLLAALGLSVLINLEQSYLTIDRITGIPNLARYLLHASALVAAAAVQSLFLHLGDPSSAPRRARWRWILLGGALAIMMICFVLGDFDISAPRDFAERYATTPRLGEYMLVFLSYVGLAMADVVRMSVRYSRQLPASLLRVGIRLLAIGASVGIIYVLHKAAFILLTRLSIDVPWPERIVSMLLTVTGILLVCSGLVIPSVGAYLADLWAWRRRYHLYRTLEPLWRTMHGLNQGLNLHPPQRRPSVAAMNVALYRRVIEILDGVRELSPYLDPTVVQEAAEAATEAGLPADEARATAEAAGIAAAVQYLSATPPPDRTQPTEGSNSVPELTGRNLESDARWLATVARAYADSPIVAAVAARSRTG